MVVVVVEDVLVVEFEDAVLEVAVVVFSKFGIDGKRAAVENCGAKGILAGMDAA